MPTTSRRPSSADDVPARPGSDQSGSDQSDAPQVPAPVQAKSDQQGQQQVSTLRLPFVTVSFSRPVGQQPRGTGASRGAAGVAPLPGPVGSSGGQRLLFYTGVAALGATGVVEWPVAALIATGTYLAGKTRSGQGQQRSAGSYGSAPRNYSAEPGASSGTASTSGEQS